MDLKDIAYRAGLIMAAFLLAGIFAQKLIQISSYADDAQVSSAADALRDAFGVVLSSDDGSGLVVSLGMEAGPDGAALELPKELAGEEYHLEVLSGLMVLGWKGGREVIVEDAALVPCCPPANGAPLNASQLLVLECSSKGFRARPPCLLHIGRPSGSRGALFVYVPPDDANGRFRDLSSLLVSDPSPYPGHHIEQQIEAPFGAVIKERLLVVQGSGRDGGAAKGPVAPVPFVLPTGTSIETGGRQELPPGARIAVRKETVLKPDGNVTVLTRMSVSPLP